MSIEHPFQRLRAQHHVRAAAAAETQFEEKQVRFLVQRLGLQAYTRQLREASEDGSGRLTFSAFNDSFPSFPILLASSTLGGAKLHIDPRAFLPAMFKRFDAVPFVKAYEEVFEKFHPHAHDRAIGLVFRRNGFQHGMVIFNDLELPNYSGLSLMYQGGDKKHRHRLYVQPFQETVLAIWNHGHGWKP